MSVPFIPILIMPILHIWTLIIPDFAVPILIIPITDMAFPVILILVVPILVILIFIMQI